MLSIHEFISISVAVPELDLLIHELLLNASKRCYMFSPRHGFRRIIKKNTVAMCFDLHSNGEIRVIVYKRGLKAFIPS